MSIMIKRAIALPFFAMFALIASLSQWLRFCKNFMRFGGEAIIYTQKNERKTISDVYNLLKKNDR